jgi:hypothetical protein
VKRLQQLADAMREDLGDGKGAKAAAPGKA